MRFSELEPLTYDYLVFGLGAEVNFFGVEGAPEHAFPLYTLADAVRLKDQVLKTWEAADRKPERIEDGALNIVVVGGGPTGIETAGALAELYHGVFTKDYPDVKPEQARITLVEAGPELFPMFKPDIREYTEEALAKRSVEVLTGEVVESITPLRVRLKSGTEGAHARLGSRAAGQPACPIARARVGEREPNRRRRRASDPVASRGVRGR